MTPPVHARTRAHARAGGRGEAATYDAGDEEDEAAARDAQKAAGKRALVNEDEDFDEGDEGGDQEGGAGGGRGKGGAPGSAGGASGDEGGGSEEDGAGPSGRGTPGGDGAAAAAATPRAKAKAAKGKKGAGKAAAKSPGEGGKGVVALDAGEGEDADGAGGGVDFKAHRCTVVLTLPLHAPKLLMLEIVERVAAAVTVRETPGIDKVGGKGSFGS
jgi:DNA-directed RNA polymerase I subunit RPA1